MVSSKESIKIGRSGVLLKGLRVPASFFRHNQPGKRFVILDDGERMLMHIRANESDLIRKAYLEYRARKEMNNTRKKRKPSTSRKSESFK